MPSYFDTLQRASFDGLEIPYTSSKLSGGARIGEHMARFRPGAELELQARQPYQVRIVCIFDAKLRGYGDLLETKSKLRQKFDALTIGDLTVPTEGTFRAIAKTWDINADASRRSGVVIEVLFLESSINDDLLQGKSSPSTGEPNVESAAKDVLTDLERHILEGDIKMSASFIDKMNGFVDSALQLKATAETGSYLVESKIRGLIEAMRQVDQTAQELQHPESWTLVQAFHDLAAGLKQLSDTVGVTNDVRSYVVPRTMTVQQLSMAVYKDGSHVSDLLNLNPKIQDPNDVPAGLTIKYLAESA